MIVTASATSFISVILHVFTSPIFNTTAHGVAFLPSPYGLQRIRCSYKPALCPRGGRSTRVRLEEEIKVTVFMALSGEAADQHENQI